MDIYNLGPAETKKTVEVIKTTGGAYIITGTPTMTFEELNELIGVCHHQIEYNARQNAKKDR